jgi:hypothetical protein
VPYWGRSSAATKGVDRKVLYQQTHCYTVTANVHNWPRVVIMDVTDPLFTFLHTLSFTCFFRVIYDPCPLVHIWRLFLVVNSKGHLQHSCCPLENCLTFSCLMTYIYIYIYIYMSYSTPNLQTLQFYIFIQQIYVLNILNMLHTLRFFLFRMLFIS